RSPQLVIVGMAPSNFNASPRGPEGLAALAPRRLLAFVAFLSQLPGYGPGNGDEKQSRGHRGDREPAAFPLLRRLSLGGDARELGGLESFLHRVDMGSDASGDDAGAVQSIMRFRHEALLCQGDEVGLGPASVKSFSGFGQVAPHRLAADLVPVASGVGRFAG